MKRIPYGEEKAWQQFNIEPKPNCRDCGVALGMTHWQVCCVAECENCGGQRLSCLHSNDGCDVGPKLTGYTAG